MVVRGVQVLLLGILVAGCAYAPTEPARQPTATARGFVTRQDGLGEFRDYSSIRVEILGSGLATTSDSDGYWRINGVTPGSYQILFTATGYDSSVTDPVWLYPPVSETIRGNVNRERDIQMRIDSVVSRPQSIIEFYVWGNDSTSYSYPHPTAILYVGRSPKVGPRREDHLWSTSLWANFDPPNRWNGSFYRSELQQFKLGSTEPPVRSGETLYFVVYCAGSNGAPKYQYPDGSFRWMNLKSRSNVYSFVFP
jgi:hypothetical protein